MPQIKSDLSEKRYAYIRNAVFLILIFGMEIFFFRELLQSGAMIGDRGDARLNNLIMEHWYHVFCGSESIDTLSQFYPVTNTLSYTDMLLGFSIPYSILRALGLSMFKANKLVLIGVHFLGSYCLYFLLHKIYKLKDYAAFAAVTAFSFANGYAVRIGHTQMMALSFLPLILIFASMAVKCWHNNAARRIYAMLFVTSYALLAYTGWYTFFFSAIFVLIILISYVVHIFTNNRLLFVKIWNNIRKKIIELCCYALWMIVLLVPFLYWYLPTSKMSGGRKWEEVVYYSPNFTDIANVGYSNRLLGDFIDSLKFSNYRNKGEHELMQGFSIVLLVLMAILIWKLLHKYKKKKYLGKKIRADEILYVSYARAILFSLILVVECAGLSLWWFVWKFVPGVGSLRAVSRWYYFLLLPISILFGVLVDKIGRGRKTVRYFAIVMVATGCLWLSNVYAGDISRWNYTEDLNLLENVEAPPKEAKIIAVMDSGSAPQELFLTNLDAWLIADYYGIKTINGYSGMSPDNFESIYNTNVASEEYFSAVQEWRELHQITDTVYVYDRNTKEWTGVSGSLQ